ncbi:tRNA-intron lyase [Candidatus Thorarchaeota archaeon]|nr:MAG: tRNA-intron lyase [Candidatus Thorarchaeota archaeon]
MKGDFEVSDEQEIEQTDMEESEEEEIPAVTLFSGGMGYVPREEADRISQEGFYGDRLDDGKLELEPVEILHLLERQRIELVDDGGERVESKDIVNLLIEEDTGLWTRYLVFRDLRSRGYAVRSGFGGGIDFRVYARGDRPGPDTANQLVYVLKEGDSISLNDLDVVTEAAAVARKKLVFALVDQNGEVNFYKVAQAILHDKIGDDE